MNRDVTVQDVMDREYVGVSESDGLIDTVELLLRNDAETAVVQRGSELVGVMTQEDVLALVVEGPEPDTAAVGDAMTESVPTVSPDTGLDAAADMMSAQESHRLVVTAGPEPMGILSERDLLAGRELGGPAEPRDSERAVTEASTGMEGDSERGGYEDRSICEACGTFASDLSSFNGQLLCPDCRAM
ncbi:CBS domain-containing protein [Halovenus salina]|uniref:CBS domain-containing protein n=1 Tax=Halovenus salina TaxID=1510225 RepID=A0ABD5W2L8_9EURY|nr:CBS domain-containing protein [Halovenus salina]